MRWVEEADQNPGDWSGKQNTVCYDLSGFSCQISGATSGESYSVTSQRKATVLKVKTQV